MRTDPGKDDESPERSDGEHDGQESGHRGGNAQAAGEARRGQHGEREQPQEDGDTEVAAHRSAASVCPSRARRKRTSIRPVRFGLRRTSCVSSRQRFVA